MGSEGTGAEHPRAALERGPKPDESRDALKSSDGGDNAELSFRKADGRLGIIGGNAIRTCKRCLQSDSEAGSVDRGDDRLV